MQEPPDHPRWVEHRETRRSTLGSGVCQSTGAPGGGVTERRESGGGLPRPRTGLSPAPLRVDLLLIGGVQVARKPVGEVAAAHQFAKDLRMCPTGVLRADLFYLPVPEVVAHL